MSNQYNKSNNAWPPQPMTLKADKRILKMFLANRTLKSREWRSENGAQAT